VDTACISCPVGSYCTGGTNVTSCNAGTYGNTTGQATASTACISCPTGYYCTGGANISACAPGTYSLTSQTQCSSCPQNHYCMNGTATGCLSGSFFAGSGSSSSSSCLADCSLTMYTLGTGVSAGNCSLGGVLHAEESCVLVLQTNYSLTGGSLVIRCLVNSTLSFSPPTATGFPCPVITPLHAASGNCSGVLPSGASCALVPAAGFTLASGSLTLECSLGQLSSYPTFVSTELVPLVSFVNAPSTFQLGSGLLELQATVNTSNPSGASSLQYTWSYISAAEQAAGLPPTVLPSSTNPLLQLDPSVLSPDTTYNFSVLVLDMNHVDSSGVAPSTILSTTVHVLLATHQVQSAGGADPCSSNPVLPVPQRRTLRCDRNHPRFSQLHAHLRLCN
jgi:hypothetical protein